MIKVVMERRCKPGNERSLEGLLVELRAKGMRQPGYISGETLVRLEDLTYFLTIGTWTRVEAWQAWEKSQDRLELTGIINGLLIDEPGTHVYAPLSD